MRGQVPSLAGPVTGLDQKVPCTHSTPTPVKCGLASSLIVANQHVWRSGPLFPGAWSSTLIEGGRFDDGPVEEHGRS